MFRLITIKIVLSLPVGQYRFCTKMSEKRKRIFEKNFVYLHTLNNNKQ